MTTLQKVIKYLAIAFAIFLTVSIIGGILSAVGLFGGLFSSDAVLEEVKTYSVAADIHNLDIEINAADLYIKEGDAFSVESNLKHLKVEENGGLLTIQETKKFTGTYNGAVLTVYVPAGTVFDNVNLTTGAGRLTIGNLSSGTLDFELGAGDVSIDSLVATKSADIEVRIEKVPGRDTPLLTVCNALFQGTAPRCSAWRSARISCFPQGLPPCRSWRNHRRQRSSSRAASSDPSPYWDA